MEQSGPRLCIHACNYLRKPWERENVWGLHCPPVSGTEGTEQRSAFRLPRTSWELPHLPGCSRHVNDITRSFTNSKLFILVWRRSLLDTSHMCAMKGKTHLALVCVQFVLLHLLTHFIFLAKCSFPPGIKKAKKKTAMFEWWHHLFVTKAAGYYSHTRVVHTYYQCRV